MLLKDLALFHGALLGCLIALPCLGYCKYDLFVCSTGVCLRTYCWLEIPGLLSQRNRQGACGATENAVAQLKSRPSAIGRLRSACEVSVGNQAIPRVSIVDSRRSHASQCRRSGPWIRADGAIKHHFPHRSLPRLVVTSGIWLQTLVSL